MGTGYVADGFGLVADAFAANFADPGEDAAAVAVVHDGVLVVDLQGGTDVVYDRAMPADALMMVASCSKGITATVLAILIERGAVDPEASVAAYWPEFAAAGKAAVTVGMVAAHTAGLPYPPLGTGLTGLDLHRGPAITEQLARATPLWTPGTAMAYHPVTVGTLLDEIVLRATESTIAQHLRTLIAEPLGLEMWIGLPETHIDRVVPGQWEEASPMEPSDQPPAAGYVRRAAAAVPAREPADGSRLLRSRGGARALCRRTPGGRGDHRRALPGHDVRRHAATGQRGSADLRRNPGPGHARRVQTTPRR